MDTYPHARAAIIVPCIQIDPLTIKCVTTCRRLFPHAEITVLTDIGDDQTIIADIARIIVTGPITIADKRNIGARETNQSILAFIDSDAYPSEKWLDQAVIGLDEHPELCAVAGPNVSPLNEPLSELYVGIALRSNFCALDAHTQKRQGPSQLICNTPSCNFIIRRDVYLSMGGMDASLFGGEDIEFCGRLEKAGRPILYLPTVLVYHKNRRFSQFVKQRIAFGGFIVSALKVNPSRKLAVTLLPALFVIFVLTGFAIPFVNWWTWLYVPVMSIYGAILLLEAVRHSKKYSHVPGAFLAMVVATTAPGFGVLISCLGLMPHYKKFYRNDK